jgi:hypothetical protein
VVGNHEGHMIVGINDWGLGNGKSEEEKQVIIYH